MSGKLAKAVCITSTTDPSNPSIQGLVLEKFKFYLVSYRPTSQGRSKQADSTDIPTLSSLHATLEMRENLLCIRTGNDNIQVYLKKTDKESEMFFMSTLKQPKNASNFEFVEKPIFISENWEASPQVDVILNTAIFHALKLKGWINFGFPGEQDGRVSPNSRLLVKMERFPTSKRVMYDAVLVEVAVKVNTVTVAFEPAPLCLCPLDIEQLLASDRFGKSEKKWESGGVIDLTEISENCYNTSSASVCFSLGGFRHGSVLAISKSPLASWLLSKIDPDVDLNDVNFHSSLPEFDPIYRQLLRCGFKPPEPAEYCVFRDSEWSSFSILPICCITKSFILQSLHNSAWSNRLESIVRMFSEDVRRSSEFTSVVFGESISNLKLNCNVNYVSDHCDTYSLVPRQAIGGHSNKASVKIRSTSNEARPEKTIPNKPAHPPKGDISHGAQPLVIPGSSPSTDFPEKKENVISRKDANISGGKSTVSGETLAITSQTVAPSPATLVQTMQDDIGQDAAQTVSEINAPSAPGRNISISLTTTDQAQSQQAVKDSSSKKRKEPPPPSAEDLSPALWENLVRDGGIQKTTVPAMKSFLASVKLPVSGKKEVLIERIRKHLKL